METVGRGLAGLTVGAIVAAASLVAVGSVTAGATVYPDVDSEAELRTAFADPAATQIDLSADITLTTCPNGVIERTVTTTALVVDGHGHTVTQTCDLGDSAVFHGLNPGPLTFQNITVTGGQTGVTSGGIGHSSPEPLVLTNVTVTGNTGLSGGVGGAGGVTLTGSTVTANTGTGGAGGVASPGVVSMIDSTVSGNTGLPGGVFSAAGGVTAKNSTVSGNTGLGTPGGILALSGDVSLTSSTVSGNNGGGTAPGGITAINGRASLTNSTVTNNTGAGGGAGGIFAGTGVSLVYATVASNSSTTAANIRLGGGVSPSLTSFASVVALPTGGGSNCSWQGAPVTVSEGYNWDDDGTCGFDQPSDHPDGGDPRLGPLAENGGPTATRAPDAESPLVDAILNVACGSGDALAGFAVTTDQRLLARPAVPGGGCDIGAVELQPAPVPVELTPTFTG